VDAVLVDPSGGAGLHQWSTIPEDAELVALWIGQHHPRDIALANVNVGCAECDESLDFGVLILGAEVEMNTILDLLGVVDRLEHESRQPIGSRSNLELVRIVVDDDPSERLEPPQTERHRVMRIDYDLLPFEVHELTIGHAQWGVTTAPAGGPCPRRPGDSRRIRRYPGRGCDAQLGFAGRRVRHLRGDERVEERLVLSR
jgi:hypothetical protein